MCLLLCFGCCGSCRRSSPMPSKEQLMESTQKLPTNTTTTNNNNRNNIFHSDLHLNDLSRSEFQITLSQANGSTSSLPLSMSLSLKALPHAKTNDSTLSSWAGEEELCDMDEYEEHRSTIRTALWLQSVSVNDLSPKRSDI